MGYKADNKRVVTFQVSTTEHETLKAIAARKNCSVSDLIRNAVFEMYIEDEGEQNSPSEIIKAALKVAHRAAITHLEKNLTQNLPEKLTTLLAAEAESKYGNALRITATKRAAKKPDQKKQA